eukprot:TRINITY_DN7110_c0_g1_i1.p1 TRINITY_DN7110_c0_g1~~TRINITY_DN7110_c0_g1_i1.p1  ORF type:complete len:331 (-),score=98.29 TRINITY_DN7110_c0_g1_i1:49-1041(-)
MPEVERLAPTAIVTQALCDVCAVETGAVHRAAAALPSSPVVINLEPSTLGEVIESITTLAAALGVPRLALPVVGRLNARVSAVRARTAAALADGTIPAPRRVFVAEWIDPLFTCGHWTPELVAIAGGVEVAGVAGGRSTRSSVAALVPLRPEVLLVALCGFGVERSLRDVPLLQAAPGYDDLPAAATGDVFVTDGNAYFSRSGPRLVDSVEILAHALWPAVHPLPAGLPAAVRVGKKGGRKRAGCPAPRGGGRTAPRDGGGGKTAGGVAREVVQRPERYRSARGRPTHPPPCAFACQAALLLSSSVCTKAPPKKKKKNKKKKTKKRKTKN